MEKFSIELAVRDYELDVQSIVNNSVYQNYLEHARHEFLHHHGIDFVEFAQNNILLVVKNIEMNFKNSLVSRDKFKIEVAAEKEGNLKVVFHQNIIRIADKNIFLIYFDFNLFYCFNITVSGPFATSPLGSLII